jgi:hypothetical protein
VDIIGNLVPLTETPTTCGIECILKEPGTEVPVNSPDIALTEAGALEFSNLIIESAELSEPVEATLTFDIGVPTVQTLSNY